MFIAFKRIKYLLTILITLAVIAFVINNSTALLKLFYPVKYSKWVFQSSEACDVDPYLVFAIIKSESGYKPNVQSRKGAKGLMQVTDETGRWGAEKLDIEDFTPEMLYDPDTNIRIGTWYLSVLKREFNNDIKLMITAYNCGNGKVKEWLKNRDFSLTGENLDKIPYKETHNFLNKVINDYRIYKKLYSKEQDDK